MAEKKSLLIPLLTVLFGLVLGVVGGLSWFFSSPISSLESPQVFTIHEGEPLVSIAQRLQDQRLIHSQYALRILSLLRSSDKDFQRGGYQLSPHMPLLDIHDTLTTGGQEMVRVTIPEGLTKREIANIFEESGVVSGVDFLESVSDKDILADYGIPGVDAEGYLFPSTYYFHPGFPPELVVRHLLDSFYEAVEDRIGLIIDHAELHDILIMASLVEKEYRVGAEAPLIASVFYNRLERRMPLGCDATIKYIITEVLGRPHPNRIFFRDLEIDHPYNTYKNIGLPPGPISNPGLIALEAAINPAETDYYYFVVNDLVVGSNTFSRTLAEHNRARAEYLRLLDN
jgi:UPF0755 protein